MLDIIRYTKTSISSKYYKIKTLLSLLDRINIATDKDNIILTIDSNMVVNQTGNLLIHSKDGYLVTSHKKTHINPEIKINIVDTNETNTRADNKQRIIEKQELFTSLLKNKQIHIV